MRWMNLEPIIQSEVSHKEKEKYHTNAYIGLPSSSVGKESATFQKMQEIQVQSLGGEDTL